MNKSEARKIVKELFNKKKEVNEWQMEHEYLYSGKNSKITLDISSKNEINAINEVNRFISDISKDKNVQILKSSIYKNNQKVLTLADPIFCFWSKAI